MLRFNLVPNVRHTNHETMAPWKAGPVRLTHHVINKVVELSDHRPRGCHEPHDRVNQEADHSSNEVRKLFGHGGLSVAPTRADCGKRLASGFA